MKKLNYEKLYDLAILKNIQELKDHINSDDTIIKIENWANKFNLNSSFVYQKICTDNIFALNFIKEPGRQNFHENVAAKHIASIKGIKNFKQLPKSGKNALVVSNGVIMSLTSFNNSVEKIKTIDFEFIFNKTQFYASHKYTKDNGGSQDNQYYDLRVFMENARKNSEKDIIFLAICDGSYYQNKIGGFKTKIEQLNDDFSKKDKLIAITINELPRLLKKYVR
jgi:hypothetical protein